MMTTDNDNFNQIHFYHSPWQMSDGKNVAQNEFPLSKNVQMLS